METRVPISGLIDPVLRQQLKVACVIKGRMMTEVLAEALQMWVASNPVKLEDAKVPVVRRRPSARKKDGSKAGA